MEDGKYARTKHGMIHCVLASLVFVAVIVIAVEYDLLRISTRIPLAPLGGMFLIWCPDMLSSALYDKISGQVIRWIGWWFLLVQPSIVFYVKILS
jgi:hypothetical protein